jgi:pyruvate-ferredoxin/flavodoxin oxidoreductase
MATRSTGFGLIASNSIQEIMDAALISQAASLKSRIPFIHFFDGFRSSHEVQKIEELSDEDMHALISDDLVFEHRKRALSPDEPVIRGTAQNPDVFFQARETVNPFYDACPGIVQEMMDKFAKLTGRQYHLFDYFGAPDAEKIIILMGSGAETVHETVDYLIEKGQKVGVLKVRLYRPFSIDHFIKTLPESVESIAVLDRTKEPGAGGEPLYMDVINALAEAQAAGDLPMKSFPKVIGGRYGLSSKEFTPAMVKAVYDELSKDKSKNHFTVGINDDVTNTSLDYDHSFSTEKSDVVRAMFYGLGADGTVGANKNSIKIIGTETKNFAQGYFVYDSKKSGSMTISHLRFGPRDIHSTYLIREANFIGCHQFFFLEKYDVLEAAVEGATFLLNSPYPLEETWEKIPKKVQQEIIDKKVKMYVIDAYSVAKETGMGARINTIMQTCFFAISGVLPREEAIAKIKGTIKKTYGVKGEEIVQQNYKAVDGTLANLHEFKIPATADSKVKLPPTVPEEAPEFVQNVTAMIIAGKGDDIPVSAFPNDGTFPTATTQWEKRNISLEIPVWDEVTCIQCNKCVLVCPHAVIRPKVYDKKQTDNAPKTFKHAKARGKEYDENMVYTLQVAPEDCTGCALCVEVCPAKNKQETRLKAINMAPQPPLRDDEKENWNFFLDIPDLDRRGISVHTVKGSQMLRPLFEFSGACTGCGETPYVKLVSQLFGDRTVIANATGCSSIYGGNLPTTPWAQDENGRGPTWSNSLFEDNAEFGMGFRLTLDKHTEYAHELLNRLKTEIGKDLTDALVNADQSEEAGIYDQRDRVEELKKILEKSDKAEAKQLLSLADLLVKKSVWIMGGDGWAYDIGYGGLDHVLASGRNVNILVLDTEVYSNTGGQMSKATPRGAVAKFAASGKPLKRKDLGRLAMSYGNVYVAQIAMGSSDAQTVKAIIEAEAYDGPSIIIAYSHCIAHGINMQHGLDQQKLAVESGYWPLYRYHPDLIAEGKNPFTLDSKAPKIPLRNFAYNETRYKMLTKTHPEVAKRLIELAQEDVNEKWDYYSGLAKTNGSTEN